LVQAIWHCIELTTLLKLKEKQLLNNQSFNFNFMGFYSRRFIIMLCAVHSNVLGFDMKVKILDCFERVGIELRKEIDDYFTKYYKKI